MGSSYIASTHSTGVKTTAAPNIILIAGPSGAGKSTFIDAMMAGGLPHEISSWLPDGVSGWPAIEANDVLKRGVAAGLNELAETGADRIICHYDTFFALRYGLQNYCDDPIWPLFEAAHSLQVVSIEPSPDQLKAQFETRFQRQMGQKGSLRRAWRRYAGLPVKRLRHRLTGKGMVETASVYQDANRIERWYEQWSDCLTQLGAGAAQVDILRVVPVTDPRGRHVFCVNETDPVGLIRAH